MGFVNCWEIDYSRKIVFLGKILSMMRTFRNIRKYGIYRSLISRLGFSGKLIYSFAFITFIYALINGITTFVMPIFINNSVKSLSLVGIILAFSSFGNISTDLVVNFFRKPISYVGLMKIIAIAILGTFMIMGLSDNILSLFLLALIWGIYTELFAFAKFDYISNINGLRENAFNHGVINNFFSLGSVIGPILASSIILISWDLMIVTGMVLIILMGGVFYFLKKNKKMPIPIEINKRKLSFKTEIKIWKKVGFKILPLLVVLFIFGMGESAILSFAPIFSGSREGLRIYSGLILSGFYLPLIMFSPFFGKKVDQNGEKKYILLGLIFASVSLFFFGFAESFYFAFAMAVLHGIGISAFSTALASEESKYIDRHHNQEGRVVGESGIFYNLGFVAGCGSAGFVAEDFGFGITFRILGIFYLLATIIYFMWGPKRRCFKDGELK